MKSKLFKVVKLVALTLGLAACSSKVIEHPGMNGRFVWEDSGMPIAGVDVQYSHKGRILTEVTGPHGEVSFLPVFSRDYTSFPVSPVGLQPRWTLLLSDNRLYNPSGGGHFVKHTEVSNAFVDVGTITIAPIFREHSGRLK